MLRLLFILMPSLLIACSKDKPAPVASAGKVVAAVDAPVEPTNLRVEAITDTSARVRWDAVEGATDYDVNYRTVVGGRWTNEPHKGTRLYNTIYDLEPNTEYRWAVRAENRDGRSDWVFAESFTTLGTDEVYDNSEAELFREACLEIHQGLRHLILTASKLSAGSGIRGVDGLKGWAGVYSYLISFNRYSSSGRFEISGAVNIGDGGESEDFLLRGQMWLREVDSDRPPFIIATRSSIDLDRRKKKVVSIDSKFAEVSKEFLVDVKDELVESIILAYNGSLRLDESTMYIDGFSVGAKPFRFAVGRQFYFYRIYRK